MAFNFSGRSNDVDRRAVLMLALGEEAAAEVFKHLNNQEIQEIGSAMAQLDNLTRQDVESVLDQFKTDVEQYQSVSAGSDEFVRAVLTRALGNERAAGVLEDILDTAEHDSGIHALNYMESQSVAEMIQNEHPQIIATILVHLNRAKASEVLIHLPERTRNDVVSRIANFGGVQPSALNDLTNVLNELLSGQSAKRTRLGGIRTAAEILNNMEATFEEPIIDSIKEHDEELAEKIREEMFTFDNLVELEDQDFLLVMEGVTPDSWAIALKTADEQLKEKVLNNMSMRAADMLREEMEMQGAVRVSKVHEEQKQILQIARRLIDEGRISLSKSAADEYV